jgi:hypothetical protein
MYALIKRTPSLTESHSAVSLYLSSRGQLFLSDLDSEETETSSGIIKWKSSFVSKYDRFSRSILGSLGKNTFRQYKMKWLHGNFCILARHVEVAGIDEWSPSATSTRWKVKWCALACDDEGGIDREGGAYITSTGSLKIFSFDFEGNKQEVAHFPSVKDEVENNGFEDCEEKWGIKYA